MVVNEKVIDKLKKHDERTFDSIYHAFEGLVYYICFSITLNKDVAQDLTQDTFVKLLTSISTYKEEGHFKQYLMQIARNLSKNYVARVSNRIDVLNDENVAYIDEEQEKNRIILELQAILNKLESEVIILKIMYDLKFKEIAFYLDKTIGEVEAIYYKGLDKVKKAYGVKK